MREHPDLEQLNRQTKELLRGFAAREEEAAAEVNAHYHIADTSRFALHDAQLVIARSYGFESRPKPKAKAYVDGVTAERLVDAVSANDLSQVTAMLGRVRIRARNRRRAVGATTGVGGENGPRRRSHGASGTRFLMASNYTPATEAVASKASFAGKRRIDLLTGTAAGV
jgi:hypothetical protein